MYLSEFSDVKYLEDLNVVFVKWKKFCCIDDYRKPLLYALDIMKNHNNCHYVADTREGFENDPEDTKWLFEKWLPEVASTTCKAIFFIIDNDNKLKEELEGQSVELKKQFNVHYCFGLDEVKILLEKYKGE
jgi:GTPase SAR1 family protein